MRAVVCDDAIASIRATRIGEVFGLASTVAPVEAEGDGRSRSPAVKWCDAEDAVGEQHALTTVLGPTAVRRPNLVAAFTESERGIVVTDDVDGIQGDVLAGCTDATALDIATSVADLHATWWGRDDPGVPLLDGRLRRPLAAEQVERCIGDHHEVLTPGAVDVLRTLPGRIDELADLLGRLPLTVVHGDLHLDNVRIDDAGRATILG